MNDKASDLPLEPIRSSLDSPDILDEVLDNTAAFGHKRHSNIALAAVTRLRSAKAGSEVARILAAGGEPNLGNAAVWADKIKRNPPGDPATKRFIDDKKRNGSHGDWHFVNLPLDAKGYDRTAYSKFTRDNDVVQMLLLAVGALAKPGTAARFEEINALRLLAHLVGDLHQPIHVGCSFIGNPGTNQAEMVFDPARIEAEKLPGDRGGNQLLIPDVGSLHSFWDSDLGSDTVPAKADYVAFNLSKVQEVVYGWATATLMEARKAYAGISISSHLPGSKFPGEYKVNWEGKAAYAARCSPIVAERMSTAASNMAALLDAIWPA